MPSRGEVAQVRRCSRAGDGLQICGDEEVVETGSGTLLSPPRPRWVARLVQYPQIGGGVVHQRYLAQPHGVHGRRRPRPVRVHGDDVRDTREVEMQILRILGRARR